MPAASMADLPFSPKKNVMMSLYSQDLRHMARFELENKDPWLCVIEEDGERSFQLHQLYTEAHRTKTDLEGEAIAGTFKELEPQLLRKTPIKSAVTDFHSLSAQSLLFCSCMTTRSSHFRPFITFNVRQFLYEIASHPQLAKFAFVLPGNSVFFTLRPDQSDDHTVCIICPTNCGACAGKSNLTGSEVSQVGMPLHCWACFRKLARLWRLRAFLKKRPHLESDFAWRRVRYFEDAARRTTNAKARLELQNKCQIWRSRCSSNFLPPSEEYRAPDFDTWNGWT
jgi:hypothetical protein